MLFSNSNHSGNFKSVLQAKVQTNEEKRKRIALHNTTLSSIALQNVQNMRKTEKPKPKPKPLVDVKTLQESLLREIPKNGDNLSLEIPKILLQTWKSKNLPPRMRNCVTKLRNANADFQYMYFDDADCRAFIKKHFKPQVLKAYDKLVPCAYKADLWRYCALYILGGVYIDIKFQPCDPNFRLCDLISHPHQVKDIKTDEEHLFLYQAFMVCPPKYELMLRAIDRVVKNTQTNFYGENPLHPTGPLMLGDCLVEMNRGVRDCMSEYYLVDLELIRIKNQLTICERFGEQRPLLVNYPEYREDHLSRYADIYSERRIYANNK